MRSAEEIRRDRNLLARLRGSLKILNEIAFGHGMNQVERAHAALVEGAENFSGSTVEYWSRVDDLKDGRGPSIYMVLLVAERCPVCRRSKSVFVIRARGAQCHDCDDRERGLPSADDLDEVMAERAISDATGAA